MRSEIAEITLIIISIIILTILLVWIGISWDAYSCKKTAEKLNYKYEYSAWTECILQDTNGKKFLLKQLREIK